MVAFQPRGQRRTQHVNHASSAAIPDDLVVIARIGLAYGIKGWVHIHPFSRQADALHHADTWWIAPQPPDVPEHELAWQAIEGPQIRAHSDAWIAHAPVWTGRDAAEALKGQVIAVSRASFPQPADDEYYWVDMLGATVTNTQGQCLGVVDGFLDSAAHTVLQIVSESLDAKGRQLRYLIPFVGAFVTEVQLQSEPKRITVDWSPDDTA